MNFGRKPIVLVDPGKGRLFSESELVRMVRKYGGEEEVGVLELQGPPNLMIVNDEVPLVDFTKLLSYLKEPAPFRPRERHPWEADSRPPCPKKILPK